MQSETNHSNRIINPYTSIRRIANPAIEPILRLAAISSACGAVAYNDVPMIGLRERRGMPRLYYDMFVTSGFIQIY